MNEHHGIAVIGLAGRFPGAADVRQFWQNICDGVVSIETITDDELRTAGVAEHLIASAHYVRWRTSTPTSTTAKRSAAKTSGSPSSWPFSPRGSRTSSACGARASPCRRRARPH
jgi:hypothetical protein